MRIFVRILIDRFFFSNHWCSWEPKNEWMKMNVVLYSSFYPFLLVIHPMLAVSLTLRVASTILITLYRPTLFGGSCGYCISHHSCPPHFSLFTHSAACGIALPPPWCYCSLTPCPLPLLRPLSRSHKHTALIRRVNFGVSSDSAASVVYTKAG